MSDVEDSNMISKDKESCFSDLKVSTESSTNKENCFENGSVEDIRENIEFQLASLSLNSPETEDSSKLTNSVVSLNSRGPTSRGGLYKKGRAVPYSFLHFSGGGILQSSNSDPVPIFQTLPSHSFQYETTPSSILNGGDSSGIPSPINCSYGSPTSNVSLSPATHESGPDSDYGGFEDFSPNFLSSPSDSTESSSSLSSSPPDKICSNTELIAQLPELQLSEVVQLPLTINSINVEKERINELKNMLKNAHNIEGNKILETPKSEDLKESLLSEDLNDIEEVIFKDTASYFSNKQQITSQTYPQNILSMQNTNQVLPLQNSPVILQLVIQASPSNQKRYLPILPKTDVPRQSQTRIVGNVKNNGLHTPARQNLDRSLNQKKKDLCHQEVLKNIIKEPPPSIIKTDPETGMTNLHSSICQHNRENAFILIELSKKWNEWEKWIGELDKQDNSGKSALHYAVLYNEPLFVDYLLECGANSLLKDTQGSTALHCAAECDNINLDIVRKLCSFPNAINEKNNKGFTALHSAVHYFVKRSLGAEDNKSFEVILALLNNGSKMCNQDCTGKTPLHWSVYTKNSKLIKLLCENATDTKEAINKQDIHGCTALHEIASLNDIKKETKLEIVTLLLSYNAFSSIKDNKQQRPIDKINPFCPKIQEILLLEWGDNCWKYIN